MNIDIHVFNCLQSMPQGSFKVRGGISVNGPRWRRLCKAGGTARQCPADGQLMAACAPPSGFASVLGCAGSLHPSTVLRSEGLRGLRLMLYNCQVSPWCRLSDGRCAQSPVGESQATFVIGLAAGLVDVTFPA